jgi:hypothetical protein
MSAQVRRCGCSDAPGTLSAVSQPPAAAFRGCLLRVGYEIFASAGAGAFAERARIELRATGERAPKRTAQTRDA